MFSSDSREHQEQDGLALMHALNLNQSPNNKNLELAVLSLGILMCNTQLAVMQTNKRAVFPCDEGTQSRQRRRRENDKRITGHKKCSMRTFAHICCVLDDPGKLAVFVWLQKKKCLWFLSACTCFVFFLLLFAVVCHWVYLIPPSTSARRFLVFFTLFAYAKPKPYFFKIIHGAQSSKLIVVKLEIENS